LEEQRLGKPVYDALLERLKNGSLSKNQTANALVVLFQLRTLGVEPVFEAVMTALAHPHVRVRTQATTLAIGLMNVSGWSAPYYTPENLDKLRAALGRGVHKDAGIRAMALIEKGPAAVEIK
jgi:hypothetical protein